MLEKIDFQKNIPVDLAFRFPDGKVVNGQYGPSVMFTTQDDRIAFLPQIAADRLKALNVAPGEPVRIVKAEVPKSGGKPSIEWRVSKLIGEQGDGTFRVPCERPARTGLANHQENHAPAAAPVQSTNPAPVVSHATRFHGSAGNGREPEAPFAARLIGTVNLLVDAQASCIEYAKKYNSAVRPDDVRAILLTAYISMSKGAYR